MTQWAPSFKLGAHVAAPARMPYNNQVLTDM